MDSHSSVIFIVVVVPLILTIYRAGGERGSLIPHGMR